MSSSKDTLDLLKCRGRFKVFFLRVLAITLLAWLLFYAVTHSHAKDQTDVVHTSNIYRFLQSANLKFQSVIQQPVVKETSVTPGPSMKPETEVKEFPTHPSSLFEQTRRHIIQTARHHWFFLHNQILVLQEIIDQNHLMKSETLFKQKYEEIIKYILDHESEYSSIIELEAKKLASLDGWDDWRKIEDQELKKIIRNRLIKLQNPRNCSESPVLVCNLTNPAGFASGVHDVLWCFINAYNSQRRLILNTSHWHYAPRGWETFFQPLSETCQDDRDELKKISPWPGRNGDTARWILNTIPQDLGSRIIRLYGNPLAWWYGQFLWYLMRPNDHLQTFINTTLENIKFSKGIVGIHVRRTDKVGTEAKAYRLEEYMEEAERYFQRLELVSFKSIKRRVYIATDEPNVLRECHTKYPQYECLYNAESAKMASNLKTRDSNQSLKTLLADIFALSQRDFIVCTMSSGVCRVAYELKMSMDENSVDPSDKISSLDVPHYYAGIIPASKKAIYNHKSKSLKEISFSRGDVFVHYSIYSEAKEKKFDGLMRLRNKIQNTEGQVPIYKTREMFQMLNLTSINKTLQS